MKSEISEGFLLIDKRRITYRLHRGRRKQVRIVVSPEFTVDIYVPRRATEEEIEQVVRKKSPWISKTLDKLATYHRLPSPLHYINDETLVYLGRSYRLQIEDGTPRSVTCRDDSLLVRVRDKNRPGAVKRAVAEWYRQQAHEVFNRYMLSCLKIISGPGLTEPVLVVRSMRRRWGSCSSTGRITLNTKLVQTPAHCIEYVVMHELCHLRHHNHSKSFYSLLSRCMPDWQERRTYLNSLIVS